MTVNSLDGTINAQLRQALGRAFTCVLCSLAGAANIFAGIAVMVQGSSLAREERAILGCIEIAEGPAWIWMAIAVMRARAASTRRSLGALLFIKGIYSVAGFIFQGIDSNSGLTNLILAPILIFLGVGLWRARGWAPRACALLGAASFVSSLIGGPSALHLVDARRSMPPILAVALAMIVFVVPAIALAIYGILPSTRQHFAEAREAMARAKAVAS